MSKIEVDKVDPQSGTALEIGTSGDTINVPSGVTLDINSGATISNSGTATGFAGIAWQSVVTGATLTAVAGNGYPINTTSNACTVTLPASASVGDQIIFTDYLRTWGTNNLTISSSLNYQGSSSIDPVYDTDGESVHIVYMDVTQGWVPTYDGAVAYETEPAAYVTATGPDAAAGTIDGDYKYHKFIATKTGVNGFAVSDAGNVLGSNTVEYLVVAGGAGGGGGGRAAGAGAGGLLTATGLSVSVQNYDITVGGGGAGSTSGSAAGTNGNDSVFSTLTSIGGGGGGGQAVVGSDGGSGGGATNDTPGAGEGTVGQGNDGGEGAGAANYGAGGGGGKGAVGADGTTSNGGNGGAGLSSSITGSAIGYAGGGGGGKYLGGSGGTGTDGGGNGGGTAGTDGTANTGGGAGGGGYDGGSARDGGAGGSGIVIIRYKFQ